MNTKQVFEWKAKRDGARDAGEKAANEDADRYNEDKATFEATSNPYGIDSEPVLHEAWANAYENAFELAKID